MKKVVFCFLAMASATFAVNAQDKKPVVKPGIAKAPALPVMKNLMDSFSYAVGVNIANNMKDQGINNLNTTLMVKAIDDVFKSRATALTTEECNNKMQEQMAIFSKAKEADSKKLTAVERAKGDAYLATNAKRAGVISLPGGLQYEILKAGETGGIKPTPQDTVVVDYIGTTIDGKQFDASTGRGPATFPVNGVIKGWTEILQLMTKGAHWKVYIPTDLAYGDRGAGGAIPGGATLVFEITLLEVKPATVK